MKTTANISFNELVFENRNHSYGAYYLRTHYSRIVSTAVSVTIALLLLLMLYSFRTSRNDRGSKQTGGKDIFDTLITYKPIDPDIFKKDTPKPTRRTGSESEKQIANFVPEVTNGIKGIDSIATSDELKNSQSGHFTIVNGLDPGSTIDPQIAAVIDEKTDTIFEAVSEPAEYPGGFSALKRDLYSNLIYPTKSASEGVEGKIYIRFVVNKKGKISDIQAIRSNVDELCEDAAIKAFEYLKDWKPARMNGYECSSYFTIPMEFEIKN